MKNLAKFFTSVVFTVNCFSSFSQSSFGVLKGQILDDEHQPVIGATIKVIQNGALVGGTSTDVDGYYTYKPLNIGSYDVLISSEGTQTKKITNINVGGQNTTYLDVAVSTNTLITIDVVAYTKPTIDNGFMNIKEINDVDFTRLSSGRGNIIEAVITISSEATQSTNGDLHVRGSRGGATAFIIDGVKSPEISGVPALSVQNLAVITGGIPAQYGDNTSGVIVLTTKDYFTDMQRKRMRDNEINERTEREAREKEAVLQEQKRKLEIEEELRLEKLSKEGNG